MEYASLMFLKTCLLFLLFFPFLSFVIIPLLMLCFNSSAKLLFKVYNTIYIVKKAEYKGDIVSIISIFLSLCNNLRTDIFHFFVINFECFICFWCIFFYSPVSIVVKGLFDDLDLLNNVFG